MSGAVTAPAANDATAYTAEVMQAANGLAERTVNTDITVPAGKVSGYELKNGYDFYLQNGQSIKILGLPQGAEYSVTETPEDYKQTVGNDLVAVAAQGNEGDADYVAAITYSGAALGELSQDTYVGYTNTRDGVIPTGVLLTIAPFAVGILLFGALAFFLISKRRREDY